MELGPVGIWTPTLDPQPVDRARELAAELEALGYGAIWLPEALGRDQLVHSTLLLGATERIVLATGIASIWNRTAIAMSAAHRTLTSAFPGRFLLGLGVSHGPMVEGFLGERYERPLAKMRAYLDAMDAAPFMAAPPPIEPERVLAALGPKMLELAAQRASGAHPYFVPVEHTAMARQVLGAGPLLCVEQAVVLETDADVARAAAREHMAIYLTLPNYTNNLRRMGFGDDDLGGGGSDRLVDAIVAWGDADAIATRVRQHHDAGADHVCIQVVGTPMREPPVTQWRELAPAFGLHRCN
jgi:probable F420-dependent oxidoreductase